MGWFSGNTKYVNSRAKKRHREALGLYDESEELAEQSRDDSLAAIAALSERQQAETLSASFEARNDMREGEKRAMENVERFSGGNKLAMLKAKVGAPSSSDVRAMYAASSQQRMGIEQSRMANELGVEGNFLQQIMSTRQGKANIISSFQEQADQGLGGALIGALGTYAGFKFGA